MDNRLHLHGADAATGLRCHNDRRFGWRSVAYEYRWLGSCQVDSGGLNRINLLNTACEFLLHRRVVSNLFHELAGGHRRLVFK